MYSVEESTIRETRVRCYVSEPSSDAHTPHSLCCRHCLHEAQRLLLPVPAVDCHSVVASLDPVFASSFIRPTVISTSQLNP